MTVLSFGNKSRLRYASESTVLKYGSRIHDFFFRFRTHNAVAIIFGSGTDGELSTDWIYKNLNVILITKLAHTGCAELNELVINNGVGLSTIVKEFTSGYLKTAQIKFTCLDLESNFRKNGFVAVMKM